ncbi:MAG: 30S ribosomal protein S4 [Patescibacteria group bacterium]
MGHRHIRSKNKKEDGLREKQKLMETYGLTEKQVNEYIGEALKTENKAEYVLRKLESRLDNIVYRLGFALSRKKAHELVMHGHISVNDQRVDVPSYHVEQRDMIALEKDIFDSPHIKEVLSARKSSNFPSWLKLEKNVGYVFHLPWEKELRQEKIDIDKIIELYL